MICFMALILGKLLEIKTGLSLKRIGDALWKSVRRTCVMNAGARALDGFGQY